MVRVKNSCTSVLTYAFLDNGSNVSFCSERLRTKLGAAGKKMDISVDTMGVPHKMTTYSLKGLVLSDMNGDYSFDLGQVYTKDIIPANIEHIPQEADLLKWPHLAGISLPQIDSGIDLLIGNNVADAYSPLEVRIGSSGAPYASRTRLGWVIWSLIRESDSSLLSTNRGQICVIEQLENDRRLEQMCQKTMNMDFPERTIDDKPEDSLEDKMFRAKVEKSLTLVEGHYQMALPLRDGVNLPNNKSQAVQRLQSLKRKFEKNPTFLHDYVDFMDTVFDKNYAEQVPVEQLDRYDGKVWYIPHHGIYHPQKPQKIRVVFDCSARFLGVSLNSVPLQGPDLTSSLVEVLLKFRKEEVAVMADIESMFYQVLVDPADIDCLRFLWWPRGDMSKNPVVCRMHMHLFGAILNSLELT